MRRARHHILVATLIAAGVLLGSQPVAADEPEFVPEQTVVRRTTLIVADVEKSISFYRDILGFNRWFYSEGTVSEGGLPSNAAPGDPNVFAIMKGEDPWIGMVGLLQKGHAQQVDVDPAEFRVQPGDSILMLQTSDLDGIYQRMLEAGVPIWRHPQTSRVTGAGGRQWDATFLFAFDPDGHLLEINQPHFETDPLQVRRDFSDLDHGQMHYRKRDGQSQVPLLLFHQSPLSGRMFSTLLTELAPERTAYALDTPGYGESDPLEGLPEISDYADAMIAFMDEQRIARADLFGYHTGSAIAAQVAAAYPERVRNVVLMSVPVFEPAEMEKWQLGPKNPAQDGSHLVDMWMSTWNNRAPGQTLDMVAATVAEKQRAGANEWLALRALSTFDLRTVLQEIDSPVYIINPGDGLSERTRMAAELADASAIIDKPDWGYGIFDTSATEIAAMIDDFLRDDE